MQPLFRPLLLPPLLLACVPLRARRIAPGRHSSSSTDLAEAARQKPEAQYYRVTIERAFDPVVVIELYGGDDGTLRIRRTDRKVNEKEAP